VTLLPTPARSRGRPRGRELLPVPRDRCPSCAGALFDWSWSQLSLLRHGGYGAIVRVRMRRCDPCEWELVYAVDEVTPRGPPRVRALSTPRQEGAA
jgi:hypothetical protein